MQDRTGSCTWPHKLLYKIIQDRAVHYAIFRVSKRLLLCILPTLLFFPPDTTLGPHTAVYEDDNSVIYDPERYGQDIILNIIRRKGSTGNIQVFWDVKVDPKGSLIVQPWAGDFNMTEAQWNTSIHLKLTSLPEKAATAFVELTNVLGGATLGNFSTVKIVFPSRILAKKKNNFLIIILPTVGAGLFLVILLLIITCCIVIRRKK